MSEIHIRQIYYSQQSQSLLDPGYIGLDNSSNLRPDWMEYWPIRNFLTTSRVRSSQPALCLRLRLVFLALAEFDLQLGVLNA